MPGALVAPGAFDGGNPLPTALTTSWFNVRTYGALGDGTTDDTTAFGVAIAACATAGGGIVYVPAGTYALTNLAITARTTVQMRGDGAGSTLKWVWDAATSAGSMITLSGGTAHFRFEQLRFDGSGLTNPAASRLNHLLAIGTGTGAVTETQVFHCTFGGMPAASGDGVHVLGAAGSLVSRLWVANCVFDGCSRYGVGVEQGLEYLWVVDSFLTNNETDIAVVATANVNSNAVLVSGNEIIHTGTTRHALRFEGDPTGLITKLTLANNTVTGGFATISGVQYAVVNGNTQTSGVYASTDAVLRMFGGVSDLVCTNNYVARTSGSSAGTNCTIELASAVSPTRIRFASNLLVNEVTGSGFVKLVDALKVSVGNNLCRATNAGSSTIYAIDSQAVAVAMTDNLIGPGNQITAAAGSFAAAFRLLSNGANVTDVSVVGNQADQCDYGIAFELSGGGSFNGQVLYGNNNCDSSVGDILQTGVTVQPRVGFNASTFGSNLFSGAGTPEGVVTARIGSMYLNSSGGQATTVYYKETGTGNTGWIALGGSMIAFGANDTTAAATAVYLGPGYIATAVATEIQIPVTRAGTIRNLRVQVAVAGTTSQTVTYTVRKGGSDTTLTTTINNTSTGLASDTTHSFTVAAGDLLSVSVVKAGIVATGQAGVGVSVELV